MSRRTQQIALILGTLILAGGALLLSLVWQTQQDLFSSFLVNAGTALLLLAPLYYLQSRLGSRISEVQQGVEDTQAELIQTEARLDALSRSEEVTEEVTRRLQAAHAEDESAFEAIAASPSFETLRDALLLAERLGVVSVRMPRVRLWDTHYMVRFKPGATLEASTSLERISGRAWLTVSIERGNGQIVDSFEWESAMSAADLGEHLGAWLTMRSEFPGVAAFDPGRIFEDVKTLLLSAHRRMFGTRGISVDLGPVIQLCGSEGANDRWWITDVGVQRDGELFIYTIPKDRFGELDWDRHVVAREGVDAAAFREAFETAQALFAQGSL